jgi:hypothetical protein
VAAELNGRSVAKEAKSVSDSGYLGSCVRLMMGRNRGSVQMGLHGPSCLVGLKKKKRLLGMYKPWSKLSGRPITTWT